MAIISTLYGRYDATPPSTRNGFTVDLSSRYVPFDTTSLFWQWRFSAADDTYKFQIRDNFRLLSYGLIMPHGISFACEERRPVSIVITGNKGTPIAFPQCPVLLVPWADYEIATDVFIDWSGIVGSQDWYEIGAHIRTGNVSMLGLPSSLDGLTLYPIPWIKVLHTLPLTM